MGHGIDYNLIREIETEHALITISQQADKRVVIPDEENLNLANNKIALMVADNIDNLENTITGLGTSHRVNSILVTKGIRRLHEGRLAQSYLVSGDVTVPYLRRK